MSQDWTTTKHEEITCKQALFIEGLPGIGNVGKVVVDYLIEELKAKKIVSYFSYALPNTVFVNEENLIELPKVELYHTKHKGKDLLLLTGDVQPASEEASYAFSELIIKQLKKNYDVKEIITLGGIGLQEEHPEPDVYCTGNDKKLIETYTQEGANPEVYGTVGPIIGITGLLLGFAQKEELPAVALLSETLAHPMYLGLRAAKATLQLLNKVKGFDINLEGIDEEIELVEAEDEGTPTSSKEKTRFNDLNRLKRYKDTNYIG